MLSSDEEILKEVGTLAVTFVMNSRAAFKTGDMTMLKLHEQSLAHHLSTHKIHYSAMIASAVRTGILKFKGSGDPGALVKFTDLEVTKVGEVLMAEGVMELLKKRSDPGLRVGNLREQLLRWVYHATDDDHHRADLTQFDRAVPGHLGTTFTWAEIVRVGIYLREKGLVEGWIKPGVDGSGALRLTVRGIDCLIDYDADVSKFLKDGERPDVNSPTAGGTNYYGPVFQGTSEGAQLAWNNNTSTQTYNSQKAVTTGYEDVAKLITTIMQQLPRMELPAEDYEDAEVVSNEILAEVVAEEPSKGKIRRAIASLKGLLLPVASAALGGAGEGASELAKQAIEQLGNVTF